VKFGQILLDMDQIKILYSQKTCDLLRLICLTITATLCLLLFSDKEEIPKLVTLLWIQRHLDIRTSKRQDYVSQKVIIQVTFGVKIQILKLLKNYFFLG